MDFDSTILKEVGGFGRYQKMAVVLFGLPCLVAALQAFLQVFTAGQSDHWCQSWGSKDCGALNLTQVQCENLKRNITIPMTVSIDNQTSFEQCEKFNVTGIDFETALHNMGENVSLETIPCDEGWVHDRSVFPSTIIIDFELVCERSYLPNVAQSIYFTGQMIGMIVFGLVSDIFGRRKSILLGYLFGCVTGIATGFSIIFWMYIVLRLLTSAFLAGIGLSCFVLANELVAPSKRVLTGNVMWIHYSVGYGVLAGLAKLIPNWRILQVVATLPYIPLFILTFFFISESPRWLANQGRSNDADKVIANIAKVNKRIVGKEITMKNCTKEETQHSSSIKGTYHDVIRSWIILVMMVNLSFNFIVQAFVYIGLSFSTSSLGIDPYISFVLIGAVEIPAYLSCLYVAEWLGRKGATFGSLILSGVCCCVTPFVPFGIPRAAVAILGKFFITISYSVVVTWSVELIPTSLRSSGLSLLSMGAGFGAILSPFVLILGNTWPSLPVLLFGVMAIVAGLLCLLFPETKGKSLPSTVRETEHFYRNAAFEIKSEEPQVDDVTSSPKANDSENQLL